MLSKSTLLKELRHLNQLWKQHTSDRETYKFIRGAEFALAWALDGPNTGCKVSALIAHRPQMEADLQKALEAVKSGRRVRIG